MSRLVVVENVTLDGVMQAPGGADEDTRGGFAYGGWAHRYADRVMAETMGGGMGRDGALLFGRLTYEQFYGFWSKQTDGNPYTEVLTRKHKYVASRTLAEPLPWENSSLITGDVPQVVATLKANLPAGADLVVLGSGQLVRSLAAAGLVDVYTLSIHPLVLGSGTKLFAGGEGAFGRFDLVEAVPTTTGVIIATYHRRIGEDDVA